MRAMLLLCAIMLVTAPALFAAPGDGECDANEQYQCYHVPASCPSECTLELDCAIECMPDCTASCLSALAGGSSTSCPTTTRSVTIQPYFSCGSTSFGSASGSIAFKDFSFQSANDLNDCAISGRIVGGSVDDCGSLQIGPATARRNTCERAGSFETISSTSFNPQNDMMSWSVTDTSTPRCAAITAYLSITYGCRGSSVWDGTTCTQEQITNARVSPPGPVPQMTDAVLYCSSSVPGITSIIPVSNTTLLFTPGSWSSVGEQVFSFNAGIPGVKNITCTIGGDTSKGRSVLLRVIKSANPVDKLTVEQACLGATPQLRVTLSWPAVLGAEQYRVYVNDVLNATLPNTTLVWSTGATTPPWLQVGQVYNWSVAAVENGQEGARAWDNVTAQCNPDAIAFPERFHHGYFAKVGSKQVMSYWADTDAVLVFKDFSEDLMRFSPKGSALSKIGTTTVVTAELDASVPEDVVVWRGITTSLRIS